MTRKHSEWAARELAAAHHAGTFNARETHAIKTFCATLFAHFNPRFELDAIRKPRGPADCRRRGRAQRAGQGARGVTRVPVTALTAGAPTYTAKCKLCGRIVVTAERFTGTELARLREHVGQAHPRERVLPDAGAAETLLRYDVARVP